MLEYKRPQKMLGPSQVSAALGYSKFDTPETLRKKLEEGYTREIRSSLSAGRRDEPRCRALYARETGAQVHRGRFMIDPHNSRFGGICDGLIGKDGGVEIKCQYGTMEQPRVYFDYKLQAVAYMYLYGREWWDILVCRIDTEDNVRVVIERLYWSSYQDKWENHWYPQICQFTAGVQWKN